MNRCPKLPGHLVPAVAVLSIGLLSSTLAWAQVAPTPAELVAYRRDAPLHAAAAAGDVAMVERALSGLGRGAAALEARDGHGRTPIHVATFARHAAIIERLAAAGADLDALEADRYDPVTIAAVADDETTLRLLLKLGARATNVTSRWNGTALIAAAHLGHDAVVRQLIAAGAPLDHVNSLHWTAVIESIVLGDGGPRHQATLRALVDAGADLSLADRNGATPLALARQRGYREMVAILEAPSASPTASPVKDSSR
jgi:ankyrin repeat protein